MYARKCVPCCFTFIWRSLVLKHQRNGLLFLLLGATITLEPSLILSSVFYEHFYIYECYFYIDYDFLRLQIHSIYNIQIFEKLSYFSSRCYVYIQFQ